MMLWEKFLTDCVKRQRTKTPDGEGGNTTVWSDGSGFSAAIVKNTDAATRIAERDTDKRTYTVTAKIPLGFHEAFKRLSDGQTFRIISNGVDSAPPSCASFGFYQMQAEAWEEAL